MPYREKITWLSLVALTVTFGPYFTLAALNPATGAVPDLRRLGLFAAAAIAQLVLLGLGRVYLGLRSPEDARIPPDERDRAIERRAICAAYYVLMGGMIVVGCIMPFNAGGWRIVDAALLMIVIAEVVRHGVAVASYRRG